MGYSKADVKTILAKLQEDLSYKDKRATLHRAIMQWAYMHLKTSAPEAAMIAQSIVDALNESFAMVTAAEAANRTLETENPDAVIRQLRQFARLSLRNLTPEFIWRKDTEEFGITVDAHARPHTDADLKSILESAASGDEWVKSCLGGAYDVLVDMRAKIEAFERDPRAYAGLPAEPARAL